MAVFRFIEGWYNPARRHSGLGYLSPIAYEEMMQADRNHPSQQPSTKPGLPQIPSFETVQRHCDPPLAPPVLLLPNLKCCVHRLLRPADIAFEEANLSGTRRM